MYKTLEEINRLDSLLKPCPFCGGKARIYDATRPDGYYGEYCTDEEIADLWNRRVE